MGFYLGDGDGDGDGEKRRLALPRAALDEHRWYFTFLHTRFRGLPHNVMPHHIMARKVTDCTILYLLFAIVFFRARELLPRLVEKDMNWIDVEVVRINDITFTR